MEAGIIIQLIIIIIIIILTIIGNATMCVCINITRELHCPSGYIVASLTVADLLVGIWLLPFSIPAVISQEWTIGKAMCLVNGYTNHTLSVASILSLFIISIDRYISIFYPLRYSEYMSSKRAVILIACAWVYSFLTACLPLAGWGQYTFTKGIWLCVTDFRISYSFSYFIIFTVYGVPLTIMTYIYFRIFKIAFHHSRAIQQQTCLQYGSGENTQFNHPTIDKWMEATSKISVSPVPRNEKNDVIQNGQMCNLRVTDNAETKLNSRQKKKRKMKKFKKEMRAGIVLFIIVIIFVISWSPFAILNLWALHTGRKTSLASEAIVSRLAYLNSAINPPLYCLMNKTIRRAFKNVCFKIFVFLRIAKYFSCIQVEGNEFTVREMTVR